MTRHVRRKVMPTTGGDQDYRTAPLHCVTLLLSENVQIVCRRLFLCRTDREQAAKRESSTYFGAVNHYAQSCTRARVSTGAQPTRDCRADKPDNGAKRDAKGAIGLKKQLLPRWSIRELLQSIYNTMADSGSVITE